MTYGIIVNTDGGHIVIDQTYRRLALHGTYSITTAKPSSYTQYIGSATLPANLSQGFAFARPPMGTWANVQGGFDATRSISVVVTTAQESGSKTCEVKYFTQNQTIVSPDNYGIHVKDSSGQIVFNSNEQYACIDTVVQHSIQAGGEYSYDVTLPAPAFGRRFFAVRAPTFLYRTVGSTDYIYGFFVRLNSETSLSYGVRVLVSYPGGPFHPIPFWTTNATIFAGHML